MKRMASAFFFFMFYMLWVSGYGLSDTIYTKDNQEIKGIIIEEYKDRVLVATMDGERSFMKSDIKELYFDSEEQNFIKLAEQSRDKGDYIKSFVYYDKAFKANPNSKAAKDGIVFLQGYLFKKDMDKKEGDVKRRNSIEGNDSGPVAIKTDEEKFRENQDRLHDELGITVKVKNSEFQVDSVIVDSPAYEAGIRQGDVLIAVWGRLVKYLSIQEVAEMLLEKTSIETKCTIEHNIDVGVKNFGANFKMQLDGMTISELKEGSSAKEAGLKVGDIIVGINGETTRYMPLKKAVDLIKNSKNDTARLVFRRDLVIWGK